MHLKETVAGAFLLFVSLTVSMLSCNSAPKPPESAQPPVVEPAAGPSQASLDALAQAAALAEAARKRAIDFESNSYFPSDWEAIETQYTAAGAMPKTTDDEAAQAAAAYNAAADAYDDLFGKSIPLYAQAREDDITAIRDELIATGLRETFPNYLTAADLTAVRALNQYTAQDYYTAKDSAEEALLMYQTLQTAVESWWLRQQIIDREFDSYDADNYNQANETIIAAMDTFIAGNGAAAHEGAVAALAQFKLVLSNGWAAFTAVRKAAAETERQAALDNQADTAVPDIFNTAESSYNQAGDLMQSEQYEQAVIAYTDSEIWYIEARQYAAERRRKAEAAILPARYTVRGWPANDCLWNIAGQPWAYNDPKKWRIIYNANKTKFPNPDNPNLVKPGMVLDIPSIRGETRSGMWNAGKTYSPFR